MAPILALPAKIPAKTRDPRRAIRHATTKTLTLRKGPTGKSAVATW